MKKATKIIMSALCAAVMCVSAVMLGACGNNAATITVSGSSSVTPIMEKLAAEYEKTHDVRITINMSSSGNGIKDTQNGNNDFGMSSRDLKESETETVEGRVLCRDGIALIVSNGCAVDNVTKADVKALFEAGTAIPGTSVTAGVGRDSGSGTRSAFDELIGLESYHTSVSTLAETGNVIESIQNSNNSIGYISFGSLNDSVKAVKLDGVECTTENIVNGSYALQRPFVIVLKKGAKLSEEAQGFYDYIMGEEAQSIITANKYISTKTH